MFEVLFVAGEAGEDAGDVDVAVFEEDAVAFLGAGDGGADDVGVGDVGLHGVGVEGGELLVGGEVDADHLGEGHVGEVAGHEEGEVGWELLWTGLGT